MELQSLSNQTASAITALVNEQRSTQRPERGERVEPVEAKAEKGTTDIVSLSQESRQIDASPAERPVRAADTQEERDNAAKKAQRVEDQSRPTPKSVVRALESYTQTALV